MLGPYRHVSGTYALRAQPGLNSEGMVEVKGISRSTVVHFIVLSAIEVVSAVLDWSCSLGLSFCSELRLRACCLYIFNLFSYLVKSNIKNDISLLNTFVNTIIGVTSRAVRIAECGRKL